MANTIPMYNPEQNDKTASVHPDEVDNWKKFGWRLVEAAPLPPPPLVKPKLSLPDKKD